MSELTSRAEYLIATAARAPSVHNTQPWQFRVADDAIELYSDRRRRLQVDAAGREMLISCGAALFGLRLAVRSLGRMPVTELFPGDDQPDLLARVREGAAAPVTTREEAMLMAMPHRHTHRGAFEDCPLPDGLLPALQRDAVAEGAELVLLDRDVAELRLADIVENAGRRLDQDPRAQADLRQWRRDPADPARDGVPPHAAAGPPGGGPWRLRQRDFGHGDYGHGDSGHRDSGESGTGPGGVAMAGASPAATAVLVTHGDDRGDWLRAGQGLHRLLLHAAGQWVFASLHTQALESEPVRNLIRQRLALPGNPQLLLQLGVAHTAPATARRHPPDLLKP